MISIKYKDMQQREFMLIYVKQLISIIEIHCKQILALIEDKGRESIKIKGKIS